MSDESHHGVSKLESQLGEARVHAYPEDFISASPSRSPDGPFQYPYSDSISVGHLVFHRSSAPVAWDPIHSLEDPCSTPFESPPNVGYLGDLSRESETSGYPRVSPHRKLYKCSHGDCRLHEEGFATTNDLRRHHMVAHPQDLNLQTTYVCHHEGCAKERPELWHRADNFRSHLNQVHKLKVSADDNLTKYRLINQLPHVSLLIRPRRARRTRPLAVNKKQWLQKPRRSTRKGDKDTYQAADGSLYSSDAKPTKTHAGMKTNNYRLSGSWLEEPVHVQGERGKAAPDIRKPSFTDGLQYHTRKDNEAIKEIVGRGFPPTMHSAPSRLGGWGPLAFSIHQNTCSDSEMDDSCISDVESIMSTTPSITSSVSSAGVISGSAVAGLRGLFLHDDELEALYHIAISRVGPARFQQNLRRLLMRYGRSLCTEAVSPVQVQAAKFVRYSSTRLAVDIKEAIISNLPTTEWNNKVPSERWRLNEYLKNLKGSTGQEDDDLLSSDEESLDDRDTQSLQTLETVENFMISSQAFAGFRDNLKQWLKLDTNHAGPSGDSGSSAERRNAPESLPTPTEPEETGGLGPEGTSVKDFSPASPDASLPEPCVTKDNGLHCDTSTSAPIPSCKADKEEDSTTRQSIWSGNMARKLTKWRNLLSDRMQSKVDPGYARVSWTCRCGKRLRIQVPKSRQEAVVAFAEKACSPSDADSLYVESSGADSSSVASSTGVSGGTRSSSESSHPSPGPLSRNPSVDGLEDFGDPFVPAGTKKYMLLCVHSGMHLIRMANVDVTDVDNDEGIFERLRDTYQELRGVRGWIPLVKPKVMHYVRFHLLRLQKSTDCVGNYTVNSIPSRAEILRGEYAFRPCPPPHGDVPIPPDVFMHVFLDPGDHLGSMAAEMLPKKLHSKLGWDDTINNASNLPVGWGFYIVERVDWVVTAWCIVGIITAVTLLTIVWSTVKRDIQGGTGIGQYCIAALAFLTTAIMLGNRSIPNLS